MCEIDACAVVFHTDFVIDVFFKLVVFLIVLLIGISAHEAAHAWASYKCGDNTAYLRGRVTLNPKKHIDPIGTLLLPIAAFFFNYLALGFPVIGWGKPTPTNPRKWKNFTSGNFFVSIAGVVANLILVAAGLILAKFLIAGGVDPLQFFDNDRQLAQSSAELNFMNVLLLLASKGFWLNILVLFAAQLMWVNLMLFVFNLLPIPPLDGGHIISGFLPDSFKPFFRFVERFGFIILLVLLGTGIFTYFISPFVNFLNYFLTSA